MSTLSDIRARYTANFGATNQSGYKLPFQESTHAVGALLAVIDQQQAVIDAAVAYRDFGGKANMAAIFDALAALKDARS